MSKRAGEDEKEGGYIMENQTITISLERYEELLKKEALYDQIAADYTLETYLTRKENKYGC